MRQRDRDDARRAPVTASAATLATISAPSSAIGQWWTICPRGSGVAASGQ
jgi:hypothetical protein